MGRPNYLVLLGITEPEKFSSWALLEPVLKKKKTEWSMPHPTKSDEYKGYLGMVRDMERVFRDPTEFRGEVESAKSWLAAQKQEAERELDGLIQVTGAKGYLIHEDVVRLTGRGAGKWTEKDVRDVVSRKGLKIQSAETVQPAESKLDRLQWDQIEGALKILHIPDLYGLLQLPASTSTAELRRRADELLLEIRQHAQKTAQVNARQSLYGLSVNLFKSDAERAKYDASLRDKGLAAIEDLAKTAAEGEKKIHAAVMDELLRRARMAGIPEARALTRIREMAKTNGWALEVSTELSAERPRTCLGCGATNGPRVKSCARCHQAMDIDCPRCATTNPRGMRNCSNTKCAFAIGDMHIGESRIQSARACMQTDPEKAILLLSQAEVYWPGHPEAGRMRTQIETEREQRLKRAASEQAMVRGILEIQGMRMFEKARYKISELETVNPAQTRLGELRANNQKALDSAAREVTRARELQRESRFDEAFTAFERALAICADCSAAEEGVARCPASPPTRVEAQSAGANIEVTWQPSPSKGRLRYVVVRKVGGPPARAGDGTRLGETTETRFADQTAPPGAPCYYAVFAERDGVLGERPAQSKAAVRMLEVSDLVFEARDGGVTLRWSPPAKDVQIEVWRCEGREPARGEGVRVACFPDSAVDSGLINGRAYGYRVLVAYKLPSGDMRTTSGATGLVTPTAPPSPVHDLQVSIQGETFGGVFTSPPSAEVKIYHLQSPAKFAVGQLLGAAQLGALGKALPVLGGRQFEGRLNEANELHLLPVSVRGSVCVAGKTWSKVWTPEIKGLRVECGSGAMVARWEWPRGVTTAVLVAREDDYPSGPEDPLAQAKARITLSQYQAAGGRAVIAVNRVSRLKVAAFSLIESDGAWRHSDGHGSGSRAEIRSRENRVARYRVLPVRQWLFFGAGKGSKLRLAVDGPVEIPELRLVSKSDGLPLHPADGRVVLTIVHPMVDLLSTAVVELDGLEDPGWPVRNDNCRLFHLHPEDGAWLELLQG